MARERKANHIRPTQELLRAGNAQSHTALIVVMVLAAMLSGCGLAGGQQPTPTPFIIPTLEPPTATPPSTVIPFGDDSLLPTQVIPEPSLLDADTGAPLFVQVPANNATGQQAVTCVLDARFVADITVPDDTPIAPGARFTKTWRLENSGSCTWGEGYALVHVGGTTMGGPELLEIPAITQHEETDISIDLSAPAESGEYTGIWQIQAPDGTLFGTMPYVRIRVEEGAVAIPGGSEAGGDPPIATATFTAQTETDCVWDSDFIADVTIPDEAVVQPGESFTKTWRLENSGTCTWGAGYVLVNVEGGPLGSASTLPLPTAGPGQQIDMSVSMMGPGIPGEYRSTWQIRAPDGTLFGTRPYALINVPAQPTATPEPGATVRPTLVPIPTIIPTPTVVDQEPTNPPPVVPSGSYAAYVTNIGSRARQIYLNGQALGNRAGVFAKIGDSITISWAYLHQFSEGYYELGGYGYLQTEIDYFGAINLGDGNSFIHASSAAFGGWKSADLLNPAKSPSGCSATPIECEYQAIRPSLAIIMIGTNNHGQTVSSGAYQSELASIVEITINSGVIPILMTIPPDGRRDVRGFNFIVRDIAKAYGVPLVDYYTPMTELPAQGLASDDVHPSMPPDALTCRFGDGGLQYGYNLRNLLTLEALKALREKILY